MYFNTENIIGLFRRPIEPSADIPKQFTLIVTTVQTYVDF